MGQKLVGSDGSPVLYTNLIQAEPQQDGEIPSHKMLS